MGGGSKTFSFPLSFSLFRHRILQFPLYCRVFVSNSQSDLYYFVLTSLHCFSCFSFICMGMRIRVCKLLMLVFVGGGGRWVRGKFVVLLVLLEPLSYYPIFVYLTFKNPLSLFFWATYEVLIQKFLCFMVMGLDSENFSK